MTAELEVVDVIGNEFVELGNAEDSMVEKEDVDDGDTISVLLVLIVWLEGGKELEEIVLTVLEFVKLEEIVETVLDVIIAVGVEEVDI